jgi:hypothetical protein
MDATDDLDALDRNALQRCIPAARAVAPIYDRAINTMLARGQSWEEVAGYACHVAQTASLDVKPWQQVPALIHSESALRQPFGLATAERESAEIKLKLLALGLSRFEAFGMERGDNGWTWKPFWDGYADLIERHSALVRQWNKAVPILNAGLQDVGRPLAASEAQVATVLRLHKQGKSLRWIVDETSLGLRTVRTIVDRKHGTDRTTKARRQKIEIDKFQRAHWKAQKRTGDALPKRVAAVIETGAALVTEAKGLGRGR